MSKQKYYSLKHILAENADYNVIIGQRSNGKSYAVLDYMLDDYIKNKKQGVYLRRYRDDISNTRMKTLYTPFDISKKSKEYNSIVYKASCFYLANVDIDTKEIINVDVTPCIFCMCLFDMEHNKSTSYPNVKNIMFDEFLSRTYYLKNEFILLMNTISTIARNRDDIKIFMLGNTVNAYSPYFQEMGLCNIKNQKQGTIEIYKYGNTSLTVAVEYCADINASEKSAKYFAFDNPRLQMITGGKWEIGNYPHLPVDKRLEDKNLLYVFYIGFNSQNLQCNIYYDDDLFIFIHEKTTAIKKNELYYNLKNFDCTNPYYRCNLLKDNFVFSRKLRDTIQKSKLFFSTNEIGEIYRNYINTCQTKGSAIND